MLLPAIQYIVDLVQEKKTATEYHVIEYQLPIGQGTSENIFVYSHRTHQRFNRPTFHMIELQILAYTSYI